MIAGGITPESRIEPTGRQDRRSVGPCEECIGGNQKRNIALGLEQPAPQTVNEAEVESHPARENDLPLDRERAQEHRHTRRHRFRES